MVRSPHRLYMHVQESVLYRVVVVSTSTKEPQLQNASSSSPNRTPTVTAKGSTESPADSSVAPKLEQHAQSPMPDGLSSSHGPHSSAPTKASSPDPKVVSILELNSLLLRSVGCEGGEIDRLAHEVAE